MKTYIENPNLWAPQDCAPVLAVLIPSHIQAINSEMVYLTLLRKRLEWLIFRHQKASSDVRETHELLQQVRFLLNPQTPTQPPRPMQQQQGNRAWRIAWAKILVEESGAIQDLLAATGTRFPQPIAPVGRKATLLRLFEASAAYSLEDWLGDLVYVHTRGSA